MKIETAVLFDKITDFWMKRGKTFGGVCSANVNFLQQYGTSRKFQCPKPFWRQGQRHAELAARAETACRTEMVE